MRRISLLATMIFILITGTALGASLDGRLGLTGKAGVLLPLQDDFISSTNEARAGLAAGGGLIFGFARDFAAEVDVTRAPSFDVEISGSKAYEASLTDIAVGAQYRFGPERRLVPFLDGGADFLKGGLQHITGAHYNLEWTEGGHAGAGLDYFLTEGIALTAEVRGLFAFDGDIKSGGVKVGTYDATSFIGTFGIRLVLPKCSKW